MWQSIPSLEPILQALATEFTSPSFQTQVALLLGWIMCVGKRTEYRVFETIMAEQVVSRAERHPFDRFYNFFSRSGWMVEALAHAVCVAVVVALNPTGKLYLIVDDTLLHKRGTRVYGLGWFRDAVASTAKRVATASGNNWVVVGLAIPIPRMPERILCLPLLARLHVAGQEKRKPVQLAAAMLAQILAWYPDRQLVLVGDGAYAAAGLLKGLDPRVTYVGRMRADAAVYEPPPQRRPGQRGRPPQKGPALPSPEQAAHAADRARSAKSPWQWQSIQVVAYGVTRTLQVLSYTALWPQVLGQRPILILMVRDPEGKFRDTALFTTDVKAELAWVVATYAARWSIEVTFRSSKQVMGIEAPQHWCRQSIEKLAPWVWLMQSVIILWYLTVGQQLPQAETARQQMGPWDSEYSLRHMLKVLRAATLEATIKANSASEADARQLINLLKNGWNLAA